jgi:hypothetical protein
MADPNLGQLAASVYEAHFGTKPEDNIFNSEWLINRLSKNAKEETDGGRLIEDTLEYAENTTFRSYGELEELDTTRIDVFDAAQYHWKIIAGTVVYSDLEKLRAAAANRKFDVIAAKLENGKNSHMAVINRQAHSDGTGNSGKNIGGTTLLISSTPTTGTVGTISRSAFSFWRNRQVVGTKSASNFDNLRSAMTTLYNQCSSGAFAEHPTFGWSNQTVFEGYEGLMAPLERFSSDDKSKSADLGFENSIIQFKGMKLAFDEDAPAGELRMANNKNLKLRYLKGGWNKMYPGVDPANQLSNIHKLASFCNLSTNNSRRLGVVTAIT